MAGEARRAAKRYPGGMAGKLAAETRSAFDAEAWRRSLASRTTAASQVHERLRDDILALTLPPGAALSENDLARQFGVSRTPVREALLRLADEDLVEIVPKSGSKVSRIPVLKLMEAIMVRRALEEAAVRQAAERASRSHLAGLRAILDRQRLAEASGDYAAFHHADETFHAAIAEAAGYPGLWTLVRQVKYQVDRLRRLTLPFPGRIARAIAEHAAVADAIERHDPAAALSAMNFHLGGLEASLPTLRQQNPDFFIPETVSVEMPDESQAGEGGSA